MSVHEAAAASRGVRAATRHDDKVGGGAPLHCLTQLKNKSKGVRIRLTTLAALSERISISGATLRENSAKTPLAARRRRAKATDIIKYCLIVLSFAIVEGLSPLHAKWQPAGQRGVDRHCHGAPRGVKPSHDKRLSFLSPAAPGALFGSVMNHSFVCFIDGSVSLFF